MDINDNQILSIIKSLGKIHLIGLSGSFAKKESDSLSDIDYAVISSNSIPDKSKREENYRKLDNLQFKYFDVDFEVSRSDGLIFHGRPIDILWMSYSNVMNYLSKLDSNVGCDEFLPGGISKVIPLPGYEKQHDSIHKLIKYSNTRSIGRIKLFFSNAYFTLYTLKWLDKAFARNDYYSFNKYSQELINDIVTILFALNCEWYSEEKRLLERLSTFQIIPNNILERLKHIIMRSNGNNGMDEITINLKRILEEIAILSKAKYKDIEIPDVWN